MISFFVILKIDFFRKTGYNGIMLYKGDDSVVFKNDFCDWETGKLLSPIETAIDKVREKDKFIKVYFYLSVL